MELQNPELSSLIPYSYQIQVQNDSGYDIEVDLSNEAMEDHQLTRLKKSKIPRDKKVSISDVPCIMALSLEVYKNNSQSLLPPKISLSISDIEGDSYYNSGIDIENQSTKRAKLEHSQKLKADKVVYITTQTTGHSQLIQIQSRVMLKNVLARPIWVIHIVFPPLLTEANAQYFRCCFITKVKNILLCYNLKIQLVFLRNYWLEKSNSSLKTFLISGITIGKLMRSLSSRKIP